MTPNPFLPWLPMYAPGTLADRPMWRRVSEGFVARVDHGDAAPVRVSVARDPYGALVGSNLLTDAELVAAIDAHDTAHPTPTPPPMAGQVWVRPEDHTVTAPPGRQDTLLYVEPDTGAGLPIHRWSSGRTTAADQWPPMDAVLVAGPTPWGRDRPWTPPGWRP